MKNALTRADCIDAAAVLRKLVADSKRRARDWPPSSGMWKAYAKDALHYHGIVKRLHAHAEAKR